MPPEWLQDKRVQNPGPSGNVLVVDDNLTNRRVMRHYLEMERHTVVEAKSGTEAIETLRKGVFDLVLLDITMPEMDGYQTLEAIKQDQELQTVPVVMVSATDDMPSVIRCIELGAETYIKKPLSRAPLLARVNACFAKNGVREQPPPPPPVIEEAVIEEERYAEAEELATAQEAGSAEAAVPEEAQAETAGA